jgi:hypothetical protein
VKPPLVAAIAAATFAAAGCGAGTSSTTAQLPRALLAQSRPVGRGPLFQPSARGPVLGACRGRLGRRTGVHVELFAADRVVIVPAGIGTRAPIERLSGRIVAARCYGDLVTLEPTGLLLLRGGTPLRVSDLFRAWGQPLSATRLGPFSAPAGTRVRVFVDGRRWRGSPGSVPLRTHAVIVLQVGPYVPPHVAYRFPPGT